MMAVEPPLGHPDDPVINRRESSESVDDELNRVLNKKAKDQEETQTEGQRDYRGTDIPNRSHTPENQWEASSEDDHAYDDEYNPTEHQQTAMTELQQLKLELGYIEDEPPVYDVADRLKQLNQELAEDPTPIDDDRERSIKFKDDLVDLVAPPPDYGASDSEDDSPQSVKPQEQLLHKKEMLDQEDDHEVQSHVDPVSPRNPQEPSQEYRKKQADEETDDIQLHKMSLESSQDESQKESDDRLDGGKNNYSQSFGESEVNQDDDRAASAAESINGTQNSHSDYGSDTEDPDPKETSAKKDEEKVLVELNGKFELLSRQELKARGEAHLLPPDDRDSSPRSDSSTSIGSFQPTPPTDPRPKTAADGGARRRTGSAPPRRAMSATPARVNHGSGLEDFTYNSPYALSPTQKKYLRHRQKQDAEKQREERDKLKEEDEEKKRANNEIFEAWLAGKRRQMAQERQEKSKCQKEKKEQEEREKEEREKQDAFNAWMRTKQDQKKKEKFVRDHHQKEIDEGWYSHSKEENDKAFRRWLRKKNGERRRASTDDHQRRRIQKLQERRTRKAVALVRAIKQSQSFKYVDYYGYRN